MKFYLVISLFFYCASAIAGLSESPISPTYNFSSPHCKIVQVLTSHDQVEISVRGKLGTSEERLNTLFREGDRFIFCVASTKSTDQVKFSTFSKSIKEMEGLYASLEIATKSYMLRGGIFIIGYDTSEIKITKTAEQDAAANP